MIANGNFIIFGIFFLAFFSTFVISSRTAAGQIEVPKFKNVDEAIGWVKAKGTCERVGKNNEGQKCRIRIDLPDERRPQTHGEALWQVWTWMEVFDAEPVRSFSLYIVRSRDVSLTGGDSKVRVRSGRASRYWFDKGGKLSEVYISFFLENAEEERILDEEIPISRENAYKHGEGLRDLLLFGDLGIGWNIW
jgi:hypothetical protein